MTFKGPFQHKLIYDSVMILLIYDYMLILRLFVLMKRAVQLTRALQSLFKPVDYLHNESKQLFS